MKTATNSIDPGFDIQESLPPGGRLGYCGSFLEAARADRLLNELSEEGDWAAREIVMFGRSILQPRLTAFHGDPGVAYRYSGRTLAAAPWSPALVRLREELEQRLGQRFNCVLGNLYRSGQDSMGWHADNEPELGPEPTIASLSLGADRRFQIKAREPGAGRYQLTLAHGSLLVMAGDMQRHWLHQLPKSRAVTAPRINLTFRRVFSPGAS